MNQGVAPYITDSPTKARTAKGRARTTATIGATAIAAATVKAIPTSGVEETHRSDGTRTV